MLAVTFGKPFIAKPLEILEMILAAGIEIGQFYLAELYACGEGVPEDRDEALKWYRKSAEQGNPDAQEALELYED